MDNDEKIRQDMFNTFWHIYQNYFLHVPVRILKKAIEEDGRANPLGFRRLKRDMLEEGGYILAKIRTHLHKSLKPSDISKYYGEYENSPEKFRFESGELDSLEFALEYINRDKTFFDDFK